jgi:formylglycine-generating enzyme required for sulfatase activity
MKLHFVILIMLLAVIAPPAMPQQTPEPLSRNQVMDLVKFGMDSAEVAQRIKEHGIDFEPTAEYLDALRKAGAQDPVFQALREVKPQPLTREQVGKLVAGGIPSQRAAALVKEHGIDFLPDEEYLKTLRLAGGDDTLIAALREASKALTAELAVTTLPNAEVYLDGELQGHADAQGELAMKAKLGAHALKITLAGKKDFEQSVTLAARQANKIEARLEDTDPLAGKVRENPKDGLKYVRIPAGTFVMGCSPDDNSGCQAYEKPAHKVTITKGFWMGQTEVTVGAYKRFAGTIRRQMPDAPTFNGGWANDSMPIVNVDWNDATAFCGWAGGRLPTEAEWEYAARAGSTEVRYGPIDEVAWYYDNSGQKTHEVGQKRANRFGLYDMLGNVREWLNDWYDQNYYQNSPSQDPKGPADGVARALRGGAWGGPAWYVRVSYRYGEVPGVRNDSLGFRCGGEVFVP